MSRDDRIIILRPYLFASWNIVESQGLCWVKQPNEKQNTSKILQDIVSEQDRDRKM